jgi:uncharacterized protein YjbI with pentapeptide repeats
LARLEDGLELEGVLLRRADVAGQVASDVRLDQCRVTDVDLTGTQLVRPLLQDVVVAGGTWANLRTSDLRARRADLRNVRMTGADLSSAELEDVRFSDCRIDLASLRFARLSRVSFERCRLDEIDFTGATLESVRFTDCVLVKALWADATLTRCEMRGTDISGSGNPERLRGVRMPWMDVLASAGELAAAAGVEIVD